MFLNEFYRMQNNFWSLTQVSREVTTRQLAVTCHAAVAIAEAIVIADYLHWQVTEYQFSELYDIKKKLT